MPLGTSTWPNFSPAPWPLNFFWLLHGRKPAIVTAPQIIRLKGFTPRISARIASGQAIQDLRNPNFFLKKSEASSNIFL